MDRIQIHGITEHVSIYAKICTRLLFAGWRRGRCYAAHGFSRQHHGGDHHHAPHRQNLSSLKPSLNGTYYINAGREFCLLFEAWAIKNIKNTRLGSESGSKSAWTIVFISVAGSGSGSRYSN